MGNWGEKEEGKTNGERGNLSPISILDLRG